MSRPLFLLATLGLAACKSSEPDDSDPVDPPTETDTDLPADPVLTVTLEGTGTGQVVSVPAGIDCPGTCEASFAPGTAVLLEVEPETGAWFRGYTGDCSGRDIECDLTLDTDRAVVAAFSTPEVQWVERWGAGAAESVEHVAVRDDGSTLWTCAESGNVPSTYDVGFGPEELPGDVDLQCLASVSDSGTPEWAHVWTRHVDWVLDVDVDSTGDVVVAFAADPGFEPVPGAGPLPLDGDGQLVIARYSRTGTLEWARAYPYFGYGSLSVTDTHVFFVGETEYGTTWGTLPAPVGMGQVVAMDLDGEPLWVRGFPGYTFEAEAIDARVALFHWGAAPSPEIIEVDATGLLWSTLVDVPDFVPDLQRGVSGDLVMLVRGDVWLPGLTPVTVGTLSGLIDDGFHAVVLNPDGSARAIVDLDTVLDSVRVTAPSIAPGVAPYDFVVWSRAFDPASPTEIVVAFGATGDGRPVWEQRFPFTESNARGTITVTPSGSVRVVGSTGFESPLDFGSGPIGPTDQAYDPWMMRLEP